MTNEIISSELMNEEQLDAVVGGTRGQLSCDTKFLNALGIMDHYYEPSYIESHMGLVTTEVTAAFNNALNRAFVDRVHIDASVGGNNIYKLGHFPPTISKNVSRRELYQKVCAAVGKPDFDYSKYL